MKGPLLRSPTFIAVMVAVSFLSTLFFALAVQVAASPVERKASLPHLCFTKHVNHGNILKYDQQRVNNFKTSNVQGIENRAVINSEAKNKAVTYVASVGVGNPATNYDLIIDTGSSNTWLGAGKAYQKTSTSQQTSDSVSEKSIRVEYGSGNFGGNEYIDQITLASGLVINKQSIGVASTAKGFSGVDGILGVGPTNLTIGTLSPDDKSNIPTVTDNLYTEGTITEHVLSISFEPITDSSGEQLNGELTWGGTDPSKFTSPITYTPITSSSPANKYWGIDASMTYGTGGTTILSSTAGIVDTGTTLVLIATDAFNTYQQATGGVPDSKTGLLSISSAQFEDLKSLFVNVDGVAFELTANAQIWPRSLNSAIGGTASGIYLIVGDNRSKSGSGLDFILGQSFLERFYSVYDSDTTNPRVGLATTPFTTATTN